MFISLRTVIFAFRRVILLRSDIWTKVQVIFASRVLVANIISLLRMQKYHYAVRHNITLCKAQNITNSSPKPSRFSGFYFCLVFRFGANLMQIILKGYDTRNVIALFKILKLNYSHFFHSIDICICLSIGVSFLGCLNIIPSTFKSMNYNWEWFFELFCNKTLFLQFLCNIGSNSN